MCIAFIFCLINRIKNSIVLFKFLRRKEDSTSSSNEDAKDGIDNEKDGHEVAGNDAVDKSQPEPAASTEKISDHQTQEEQKPGNGSNKGVCIYYVLKCGVISFNEALPYFFSPSYYHNFWAMKKGFWETLSTWHRDIVSFK